MEARRVFTTYELYVCVCVCVCVCARARVHGCVYTYIYIYAYKIEDHMLHNPFYLFSNLIRRANMVSMETFKQSNSPPDIRGYCPQKYVHIFC